MKKPAKPDLLISIILIIFVVGFSGIAELIFRTSTVFHGFIDHLYYKILGFFLVAGGILWIWWTGHLLRAVTFGSKLKYNIPLTFARHPYYAATLYAFYPGIALILGRFEILLAGVLLIFIAHLILFRLPGALTQAEKNAKKNGKLNETIVKRRSKSVKEVLTKDAVLSPYKYLMKYGKTTEFVEVFAYIFLIVFVIEIFVNPLPVILPFNLQLILGIFIGVVTIIWVFWTLLTLKQKKQSQAFFNSGPYKYCRHPFYAAFLFGLYPLVIIAFNSSEFLISFPFLLAAAHMIAREEEYYNWKIFGEKWADYAESHPRFFPFFGANKENASKQRKKFAMSLFVFSGALFLIVVLLFAIALTGVFSINYDSFYLTLMIILLVVSALTMLPAWEYRKRICTILVFIITLFIVVIVHHSQVSKSIYDEVNEFIAEVQNPNSQRWIEYVENNVLMLNDNVKINAQEFIDEHEKLLHNLNVGILRDLSVYRQIDFIFPFVEKEHKVLVTLHISKDVPEKPVKSTDSSMSMAPASVKDPYKAENLQLLITLKKQNYSDWRKDLTLPKFRIQSIELQN